MSEDSATKKIIVEDSYEFPISETIFDDFINKAKEQDSVAILNVLKCPSTSDAENLLKQDWLRLSDFPLLRVEIDGKIKMLHDWKPKINNFQGKSRFLVLIESNGKNQQIFNWLNADTKDFLTLDLTDEKVSPALKEFTLKFIIDSLTHEKESVTFGGSSASLVTLKTSTGLNLLIDAVIKNRLEIVRELLTHPFDIGSGMVIDMAWDEDHQEIVLELLKAGSPYPDDYFDDYASFEVRKFHKISVDLHAAISERNLLRIDEIITKNRDQRFFFSSANVSAVQFALLSGHLDIYERLILRNLTFGPGEILNLPSADDAFLEEICSRNAELSLPLPRRHLMVLHAMSVIPPTDLVPAAECSRLISVAFASLDAIEAVRLVLTVVAAARRTQLRFDFTQASVIYMDPLVSHDTRGLFNSENFQLLIAARGLLSGKSMRVCETLAHEMDHCSESLVFRNGARPYAVGDATGEAQFAGIIEACRAKAESEEVIAQVFELYDEEMRPMELIVRVPQLMMKYTDNKVKLRELKEIFPELFDYYETVVMRAMREAVPVLEKLANDATEITFDELTEEMKAAVRHASVTFQGASVELQQIADDQVLQEISSRRIRDLLDGKSFEIGDAPQFAQSEFYVERKFIARSFEGETHRWVKDKSGQFRLKLTARAEAVTKDFTQLPNLFLISDEAGTGKSTTLRHISAELKEKFCDYWVSYIDLKCHKGFFKKEDMIQELTEKETCEILKSILSLTEYSFESSPFTHLFTQHRVFLFFDGFDEIPEKFHNFIISLIKSTAKTMNHQILATRSQHTKELEVRLNLEAYKLLPFNELEARNFIELALGMENAGDEDELFEEKFSEIHETIRKLRFIATPLMMRRVTHSIVNGTFCNYSWIPSSVCQTIPDMKSIVCAGKDSDGNPVYVGRAYHDGLNLPAMVVPAKRVCLVTSSGEEIFNSHFDYLKGSGFAWIATSNGSVPSGAFQAGNTSAHEPLFVGRMHSEGSVRVGKVQRSFGLLFYPYNGEECQTTHFEVLVRNSASEQGKWVPSSPEHDLPPNAVYVGDDTNGDAIYVGRCTHKGEFGEELLPAKVIPGKKIAYVAYDCCEHQKYNYSVLCGSNFQWLPSSNGLAHSHAVVGGYTCLGETLFIGRVSWMGSLTCGKIHPSHSVLYIPYNGRELAFRDYEVLVEF